MKKQDRRRLAEYLKKGFEIRFPGGKSKDSSFASFGVYIRYNHHTGWEALMVAYRPLFQPKKKEEDEIVYKETPEGVLAREYAEETGVVVHQFILIADRAIPDNREAYKGEEHIKHAYVITGADITGIKVKTSPFSKNTHPFWVSFYELERVLWPHHRWIFKGAKEFIKIRYSV